MILNNDLVLDTSGIGGLFGLGYLFDYVTLNEQISVANQAARSLQR